MKANAITKMISLVLTVSTACLALATDEQPPKIRQITAPTGAPNVVLVLLDDVGFGAAGSFGGPVPTPALSALAQEGLSYNRFHTTAICSPTRAALLTGRDSHATGIGTVMNVANSYPGYRGVLKKETATVAEVLRQQGYNTAAFGKWHLTPNWESSPAGPFDRWPTGVGFEKFYGFLGGETDQFEPTLYDGTSPVMRPKGKHYHLTEDMTTQAINWLRTQHTLKPNSPFMLYFAPGATHAPHQAPAEWIARFRGKFDTGWDTMREATFVRQRQLGVIPDHTQLTPRNAQLPAWESLSHNEQRVAARLMEAYAGFLAHTDAQIGRLIQSLKESGQFDNTLFVYIVGDNGGSAEGGLLGGVNYMGELQGLPEPISRKLQRIDDIGGPDSFSNYSAGWAWAMNTPFQWVKQVASHLGGTRNPMVLSWPKGINTQGELRSQFSHVNDLAPTILEAAGINAPTSINGVKQLPMDGTSLVYSFNDAEAKERHTTQYFEVFGNRAIYHDGWMASAFHGRLPWTAGLGNHNRSFAEDRWELYDLHKDFSQADDLADKQPERLKRMQARFDQEAKRVGILPLRDASNVRTPMPSLNSGRKVFTYYPGTIAIPESEAPPMLNRSWELQAELQVKGNGTKGVIVTIGGTGAGWSLYLDQSSTPVFEYRLFEVTRQILKAKAPLSPGQHQLYVDFTYDGNGYAKGGLLTFTVDGKTQAKVRLPATPPALFSIDETFDLGIDTGSPAGTYPAAAELGYPLTRGVLKHVTIEVR